MIGAYMGERAFNHNWIEEGKILAGSIPTSAAHIDTVHSMGICAVLRLTQHDATEYPGVAEALLRWSMIQCHAPIVDGGIPDEPTLQKALDFIDAHYPDRPIYVHCRRGLGRTGVILQAWYVLRRGFSLEAARNQLRARVEPDTGICAAYLGSPQPEFVAALAARVGRA